MAFPSLTQITSAPLTARVEQEIKAGAIAVDVITTADRAPWTGGGSLPASSQAACD